VRYAHFRGIAWVRILSATVACLLALAGPAAKADTPSTTVLTTSWGHAEIDWPPYKSAVASVLDTKCDNRWVYVGYYYYFKADGPRYGARIADPSCKGVGRLEPVHGIVARFHFCRSGGPCTAWMRPPGR
jgi:hypothetical protein